MHVQFHMRQLTRFEAKLGAQFGQGFASQRCCGRCERDGERKRDPLRHTGVGDRARKQGRQALAGRGGPVTACQQAVEIKLACDEFRFKPQHRGEGQGDSARRRDRAVLIPGPQVGRLKACARRIRLEGTRKAPGNWRARYRVPCRKSRHAHEDRKHTRAIGNQRQLPFQIGTGSQPALVDDQLHTQPIAFDLAGGEPKLDRRVGDQPGPGALERTGQRRRFAGEIQPADHGRRRPFGPDGE